MNYCQICSRRTLYKILRFVGYQINEKAVALMRKSVDKVLL